jgi:hypothetical protein
MSKQSEIHQAIQLISEGRYSEARAILYTINDPEARKWEARMIYLGYFEDDLAFRYRPDSKKQNFLWRIVEAILARIVARALANISEIPRKPTSKE